jgi:hypothetical protein
MFSLHFDLYFVKHHGSLPFFGHLYGDTAVLTSTSSAQEVRERELKFTELAC